MQQIQTTPAQHKAYIVHTMIKAIQTTVPVTRDGTTEQVVFTRFFANDLTAFICRAEDGSCNVLGSENLQDAINRLAAIIEAGSEVYVQE